MYSMTCDLLNRFLKRIWFVCVCFYILQTCQSLVSFTKGVNQIDVIISLLSENRYVELSLYISGVDVESCLVQWSVIHHIEYTYTCSKWSKLMFVLFDLFLRNEDQGAERPPLYPKPEWKGGQWHPNGGPVVAPLPCHPHPCRPGERLSWTSQRPQLT